MPRVRRLAILQHRQPDACTRTLEAHDRDSQTVVCAKASLEFEDDERMKPSPCYERVVDVMEKKLMKFALLTRGCADYLADRYSGRRESAEALSKQVNLRSI